MAKPNIQITLDEGQTKIVNMCKLVNSLDSKDKAIGKIILDWGTLQSLSEKEIENKVIEYFKERWSGRKTHNGKDWIKDSEEQLKKAYKDYSDKIHEFPSLMVKKYKVKKEFVNEFMYEENWTDDEFEMEDTKPSDKKKKFKIFNEFQDLISKWQEEIGKKYDCKIEHDEFSWSSEKEFGPLTIQYCNEFTYYLDSYVQEVIKQMIKILRGSKSLRDIMDENRFYLEQMERQADKYSDNLTKEDEEEMEAKEQLIGL